MTYNFGAGINFRVIDGALYLDANGDGSFSPNPDTTPNDQNSFTAGLTDELAVVRNGDMSATTNFAGDGADMYAAVLGHATSRRAARTCTSSATTWAMTTLRCSRR